jgi:thiol-disulfide isomerase/thioredoxin
MKLRAEEVVSMKTICNTRKKSIVVLFAGLLICTAFVSIVGNWNFASDDGHELNADLPPEEPRSPAITTRSVLVELFTGTWCPPCQGAEGALDRLADEYPRTLLSILEYHYNDPYQVPGNHPERALNYYGVTSWPTAFFDGIDSYIGGASNPNDTAVDDEYRMRIDNRIPVPSEVSITLNGTLDMGTGIINANISALDHIPPMLTNLKARFVVYEDHNYSYFTGSPPREYRLRYTVVENLPEEAITLTKEQSLEFTKTFAIDPTWDVNKLGAVVFVQADNTKEVIASASFNLSAAAMKSDLTISPEDISFSNPNPTDGDTVTIYLLSRPQSGSTTATRSVVEPR